MSWDGGGELNANELNERRTMMTIIIYALGADKHTHTHARVINLQRYLSTTQ